MSTVVVPATSYLTKLPPEIIFMIIECGLLYTNDKWSLRWSCRILYYMIPFQKLSLTISRLHIDQYLFTQYPLFLLRHLVWEELGIRALCEFCHDQSDENLPERSKLLADSEASTGPLQFMPVDCLEWRKHIRIRNGEEYEDDNDDDDEQSLDFRPPDPWLSDWLEKDIRRMRCLKSITVRIRRRNNEYKAGVIGCHKDSTDHYYHKSLGVAIALLILSRLRRQIQELNLSIIVPQLGFGSLSLKDKDAFRYLTSLSICVFNANDVSRMEDDILILCIQAAKSLKSLKLCFPCFPTPEYFIDSGSPLPWNAVFVRKLFNEPRWPYLESFHIIGNSRLINIHNDGSQDETNRNSYNALTNDSLLPIANLGKQLRILHMEGCRVNYRDLRLMRDKNIFPNLECIKIHFQSYRAVDRFVPPDELLAFLKRSIPEYRFEASVKGTSRRNGWDLLWINTKGVDSQACWMCFPPLARWEIM
ncbi:hypothetical protein GGR51DRAFT_564016 [Nemania sp. FL0031]|nr:hypothetical protein GGR51DRAFT_564016 [Nemania sp. FL0031]